MKTSSVTLERGISFEMGTKLKWVQRLWKIHVENRCVNGNIHGRIQAMCDETAKHSKSFGILLFCWLKIIETFLPKD